VLKPEPSELHDLHDEAGQPQLKRQPVDLGELSTTLVQRILPLAQIREVAIETEIREGLPLVSVDADRIVQVLQIIPSYVCRPTKVRRFLQVLHKSYTNSIYLIPTLNVSMACGCPRHVKRPHVRLAGSLFCCGTTVESEVIS
jgi:hypothetical protein